MVIINGLPGTGKTTLRKILENKYGYKYVNDWNILKQNNIKLNKLEDKVSISNKYSKLIADNILSHKEDKIVFDLEYSISPSDFIKYKLNNISQCFYLGFSTLPNETIFNLFRNNSSNSNKSDDELKQEIEFYKNNSIEYQKQCNKHNLEFIDICKDRKLIFEEILYKVN